MSNLVLVLDTNRKPLNPCTPGVARSLLKSGKASLFRRFPFTIVLNKAVDDKPLPMQLKLDPGSKVTGIALIQGEKVVFGAELIHRGQQIKDALESRRALRRGRRNRKTRYRKPRFLNRTRPDGWLPPSLQHRVETILTWVNRLRRSAPIASISQELVRFDLQQMDNPEISSVEYQQGTLFGYEVREYLLSQVARKLAFMLGAFCVDRLAVLILQLRQDEWLVSVTNIASQFTKRTVIVMPNEFSRRLKPLVSYFIPHLKDGGFHTPGGLR